MRRHFLLLGLSALTLALGLGVLAPRPLRAAPAAPEPANLIPDASMDDFAPSFEIWKGVDDDGNINVPVGYYPIVNESGGLEFTAFAPSPAVANFGRGVLDLLVADSAGHVWYYANSGTAKAPKFESGIPMPFLLTPVAQTIQLEDMDNDDRPDLIVGNGLGNLAVVMNGGNQVPKYDSPSRPDALDIRTRHDNKPWCNFLSPAYAAWCDPQRKDLLMGDGTYASDNVYYLKNHGTDAKPAFDDPVIAILGGGREQINVAAWYQKPGALPDLVVGDRKGNLTWYANISTKDDAVPRFKDPKPLKLGSEESFGAMVRFSVADLNGDGKPDLILGQQDGTVQVAYNTGTADDPKFDHAEPLKAPPTHVMARPAHWSFGAPEWGFGFPPGSFFHHMSVVGADEKQPGTYEKGFAMPEKSAEKHALKFSFDDPPSTAFRYPVTKTEKGEEEYIVNYAPDGVHPISFLLQPDTKYEISFDIKGDGFEKIIFYAIGQQAAVTSGGLHRSFAGTNQNLTLSSEWRHVRIPFTYKMEKGATTGGIGFWMKFHLYGKGVFYLTNYAVRQVK
jgi:hypothetical protein